MALSKADLEAIRAMFGGSPAATAAAPVRGRKAKKARKVNAGDPSATYTVEAGTREGFVQLRFTAKPTADVRANLKANGFRWSGSNGVWYGPKAALAALTSN